MIEGLFSFFKPNYPKTLVYMLQRCDYQVTPFLKWHWQTENFDKVTNRGSLVRTKAAKLLLFFIYVGILIQIIFCFWLIYFGINTKTYWEIGVSISLFLSYPLVWAYAITVPLILGKWIIIVPNQKRQVERSKYIFSNTKAVKIAVAGSYGKTTMKELLAEVLSGAKVVAVTPANKNVAVSHAQFAAKLSGKEEVVIIEFGEGKPGDVVNFTKTTTPDIAVITGLAPAHLDHYKDLEDAGTDIFSLAKYLNDKNVYVNGESMAISSYIKPKHNIYSYKGVGKYSVKNIKVDFTGTSFEMVNKDEKLHLKSALLGRHQVGPLAAVAVIALSLDLSPKQVEAGIAKTVPFEHRMQPRMIGGAWVIDDTYNGNIDGIRAGLNLLVELPANRKVYITPGLVDQGIETTAVHETLGRLIAEAKPDQVILMRNSVTDIIQKSLEAGGFYGELKIENDPLNFYTNLEQFIAAGDLVLMQNDWPDNYY